MYSLAGYSEMIADQPRVEAYVRALRETIRPGSVVLDIGTGTGFFAVLATQLGARRVYAIEPDDAIEVARETARRNGCADKIEFIQELSTRVQLPEPADVVLSDLRGIVPLFQHHLPSVTDARKRLLAPGGVQIPQRDTLWMAIVDSPEFCRRHTEPWRVNTCGVDLSPVERWLKNTWCKGRFEPSQLLTDAERWATLDYTSLEQPNVSGEVNWTVAKAGTGHGFCLWFDTVLIPGVGFSNAPGGPELIYGSAFFPWFKSVPLDVGDTVSVALSANLVNEDYVWRWSTHVLEQGHTEGIKAEFQQTTFLGLPLSPDSMRKRASTHIPTPTQDALIDRDILVSLNGQASLRQIAEQLVARYPDRFTSWEDALTRVGDLSLRYSSSSNV